jgi:hypothetical protein
MKIKISFCLEILEAFHVSKALRYKWIGLYRFFV